MGVRFVRPTDRPIRAVVVESSIGPDLRPTYLTTSGPDDNPHTDRSAITALTAQNSHEVRAVQTSSLPQLRTTLEALGDDFPPQAVKLGMLATAEVCVVCARKNGGRGGSHVLKEWLTAEGVADRLLYHAKFDPAQVVEEVASFLEAKQGALGPIVCDPVMVTTSGTTTDRTSLPRTPT